MGKVPPAVADLRTHCKKKNWNEPKFSADTVTSRSYETNVSNLFIGKVEINGTFYQSSPCRDKYYAYEQAAIIALIHLGIYSTTPPPKH